MFRRHAEWPKVADAVIEAAGIVPGPTYVEAYRYEIERSGKYLHISTGIVILSSIKRNGDAYHAARCCPATQDVALDGIVP
jgi:hypothetical protein